MISFLICSSYKLREIIEEAKLCLAQWAGGFGSWLAFLPIWHIGWVHFVEYIMCFSPHIIQNMDYAGLPDLEPHSHDVFG